MPARPEFRAQYDNLMFQELLKLAPSNFRVYNNLGAVYIGLSRTREAIACYEKALAIQPANAEVQQNLGVARRAMRKQPG